MPEEAYHLLADSWGSRMDDIMCAERLLRDAKATLDAFVWPALRRFRDPALQVCFEC
jgi:hypothetical protein